jgi:hypothetical protein
MPRYLPPYRKYVGIAFAARSVRSLNGITIPATAYLPPLTYQRCSIAWGGKLVHPLTLKCPRNPTGAQDSEPQFVDL